jgi:hypothetical protein
MSDEQETPYALARRLHTTGTSPEAVEQALRARGLSAEDARIAARAGRGEAGSSLAVDEVAEPVPSLASAPPEVAPTHPCPQHAAWPVTATCARCGKFFCDECLRVAGLVALPASKQCAECEAKFPPGPKAGIGGWLVLPAIHVVLAPFGALALLVFALVALRSERADLSVAVVQLFFGVAYLLYTVFTALQFFGKRRRAVPMMLGFYLLNIVVAVVTTAFEEERSGLGFGRSIITSVIWMAYFLRSERVERTFTVR